METILHRFARMLWADQPAVEILRNDRNLQAIRLSDGSVMAVFHGDGSLTVSPDGEVLSGTEGQILC